MLQFSAIGRSPRKSCSRHLQPQRGVREPRWVKGFGFSGSTLNALNPFAPPGLGTGRPCFRGLRFACPRLNPSAPPKL